MIRLLCPDKAADEGAGGSDGAGGEGCEGEGAGAIFCEKSELFPSGPEEGLWLVMPTDSPA